MNKGELTKFITEELKQKGHKVNQRLTKDILVAVDNAIEHTVQTQDEVVLGGIKVKTRLQKGRRGIIQFGERKGQEYVTTDKIVPTAKFMPSKKKVLSIEA